MGLKPIDDPLRQSGTVWGKEPVAEIDFGDGDGRVAPGATDASLVVEPLWFTLLGVVPDNDLAVVVQVQGLLGACGSVISPPLRATW